MPAERTFTMDIGPGGWRPRSAPVAGDVILLVIDEPAVPLDGPAGWTASSDGRMFWKIWYPADSDWVTFRAPYATEWRIRGYVVCPVAETPAG